MELEYPVTRPLHALSIALYISIQDDENENENENERRGGGEGSIRIDGRLNFSGYS